MQIFIGILISLLLPFGYGTAMAETTPIRCPLPKVTREITDRLPQGWRTTVAVSALTDTRVRTDGGKTVLICRYGNSGSIQRDAPEEQTCKAIGDGFRCAGWDPSEVAPTGDQPRVVAAAGDLTVRQTYKFDLDRGREQSPGADFWFQSDGRTRLYLTPQNKAGIAVGDRSARGYEGCARAHFMAKRVPLQSLNVGTYVCAKTNEGRISQFRILAITPGHPTTLRIRYTTWR